MLEPLIEKLPSGLGLTLIELGQWQEAEEIFRATEELCDEVLDRANPTCRRARLRVARCIAHREGAEIGLAIHDEEMHALLDGQTARTIEVFEDEIAWAGLMAGAGQLDRASARLMAILERSAADGEAHRLPSIEVSALAGLAAIRIDAGDLSGAKQAFAKTAPYVEDGTIDRDSLLTEITAFGGADRSKASAQLRDESESPLARLP